MRTSEFTPEQILRALRQAEGGTAVVDIRRTQGVAETTFYRWQEQCARLDTSELRECSCCGTSTADSSRPWPN